MEKVLAAVDASDGAAFAAALASWQNGVAEPVPAEAAKPLLETLHGKYGARPHRVGTAFPDALPGGAGWLVPVLFGDAEDRLDLTFVDDGKALRLVRISEGDPATFLPAEQPAGR